MPAAVTSSPPKDEYLNQNALSRLPSLSALDQLERGPHMPIDETLKSRFHLLNGINSYSEAMGNPELLQRLAQFFEEDLAYETPVVESEDHLVSGPTGTFRVRVYTPLSLPSSPRTALVWAHGGGFTGGDLDMPEGDLVSRELCSRADVVVVSVDYHLANGTASYPALHEQVMAAVRWT